jgi:hypothetical protein
MAIEIHDIFAELMGTTVRSERLECFVWIWLAQHGEFISARDWVPEQCRSMAAAALLGNPQILEQIRRDLSSQIPAHYLKWIDQSDRQWAWIRRYVTGSVSPLGYAFDAPQTQLHWLESDFVGKMPHLLGGKNRSVACFDYWVSKTCFGLDGAIERSTMMRTAWESHTRSDPIFAWLDDADGERKRGFLWQWLAFQRHPITEWCSGFQSHEELLLSLDEQMAATSEMELLSIKARKAWNQRLRRENSKGKQQCNFVLSDQAVSKLKALAQKHGLTRTEIVELLIDSEAKSESYISERLKRKALLTTPF